MSARGLAIGACGAGAAVVAAVLAAGLLRRRAEEEPPHVPGVELSAVPGVSIKRAVYEGGAEASSAGESLEAKGMTLPDLIRFVFERRDHEVVHDAALPPGRYDMLMEIRGGAPGEQQALFKQALREVFGLDARTELRTREVFELTRDPQTPLGIRFLDAKEFPPGTREESERAEHGRYFRRLRGDAAHLAKWLEEAVESPVIERTEITESFEITLEWDRSTGGTLVEALKQKGFRLTPARRPVEVLVIQRARR